MIRFNALPVLILLASFWTSACQPTRTVPAAVNTVTLIPPSSTFSIPLPALTETPVPAPVEPALVPNFSHIAVIVFENREYENVIGNPQMDYFNLLADSYTLLTEHYAVTHPSLPNYLSMIGGDTFEITSDCEDCFIDARSLPDLIEASGRTWKTYQDDMPAPCYLGSTYRYLQEHNPFIYFDPVRLDADRCEHSIVPLTQLDADIASGSLPNFIFITPDACYSAHDCTVELADDWLKELLEKLYPALDSTGQPYLLILTWDEGQSSESCCGLSESAGGHIATVLISPQVKAGFQDATPYSHYSLLKTIAEAWGLPSLGHATDAETNLITAPWK